jgi:hypothetical protein
MGDMLPLSSTVGFGAQQAKLDADLRNVSSLGNTSIQYIHYHYPLSLEDGGRLAPMAAEQVDSLAALVVDRRFHGIGVVPSRTLR